MSFNNRIHLTIPAPTAGYQIPGLWSVVVPESTTNLIANPSFETGTTGYSATGGSVARSASHQRYGVYSLAHTPAGSADAVVYTTGISTASGSTYTFSVSVRAQAGTPLKIAFYTTGNAIVGTAYSFRATGRWQRVSVTYGETATTTRRVGIALNGASGLPIVYTDGWQVEAKSYATTYCDGSQVGYNAGDFLWTGTPHGSTSTRSAACRTGGKVVSFKRYGLIMLAAAGLSMLPWATQGQTYALIGGGEYERSVPQVREFSLALRWDSTSQYGLERDVAAFIDAISPSRSAPQQPVTLRYQAQDAQTCAAIGEEVELRAVYTGGLEDAPPNIYQRTSTAQFTMYQPLILSTRGGGVALDWQDSTDFDFIAQQNRLTGAWSALGTGLDGDVFALALAPDGGLYVGGEFLSAGGVANTDYLAKWDGSNWSALSTGPSGAVYALAVGPDGALYAAGAFIGAGGVANTTYIAKWNGSAWSALGTGANDEIYALALGIDGSLYAGGAFTSIGGVAATRIAKWDGSSWSALGTGANGAVRALAVGVDGTLYAGGSFTSAGGVSNTTRIAKWDGSAWAAMSTGANDDVRALAISPDGSVYAGGEFDTIGGISANLIARWNGTGWYALGESLDGAGVPGVWALAFDSDGVLYAVGSFAETTGTGLLVNRVAIYNGSLWLSAGISPAGVNTLRAVLPTPTTLYMASGTGTSTTSGSTTITNSGGLTYPTITLTGPGTVYEIHNLTNDRHIYFNLTLSAGEQAVLTLGPTASFTSTFRGNIMSTILPGSSLTDFALQPGTNIISAFIEGATTADTAATMAWTVQYESLEQAIYR